MPSLLRKTERAGNGAVAVALAVGAALVVGSLVAGLSLRADGVRLYLGGPLLAGAWEPRLPLRVLGPVAVALVVVSGARFAAGLRWGPLSVLSALAAAAWAVALGYVDGAEGLTRGVSSTHDYLADVPRVGSFSGLLSGYVGSVSINSADPWTTHVGGHPPGALLVFATMERLGFGGVGWAAALCIAAGASAVPAILLTARSVAGEAMARRAAPYLVLTPAAVWLATSADALFLGVSAWGIAALAAATGTAGRGRVLTAVLGGGLLGCSLFLSYGLLLLGPVALAVVLVRRSWRVLLIAGAGLLAVVVAFALAGFWWLAGLLATMDRVAGGPAALARPAEFFVVANLAVVAIAIGPAGVAGLGRALGTPARRTTAALLPLSAFAAILLADLSQLSKGEVERIYLPFFGWLLTATALLGPGRRTGWLLAQAGTAIAVQLLVRTSW